MSIGDMAMAAAHADVLRNLRDENERLRTALKLEPTLTDEQHEQLTAGYGALLSAVEIFKLGWATGLGAARRHAVLDSDA